LKSQKYQLGYYRHLHHRHHYHLNQRVLMQMLFRMYRHRHHQRNKLLFR
jgi:hypothetical protein